jgi:TetR/AcrR family transcriptional repressor of nem operon
MKKQSKKDVILEKGAEIIHLKGFNNTGINEILEAADVPKGSFYFYFKNKEDFGLQLIDYYSVHFVSLAESHLSRKDLSYIGRLRRFFEDFLHFFQAKGCTLGCPIGNLSLEMGDVSESFREKLEVVLKDMKHSVSLFIQGAIRENELPDSLDVDRVADYIINSWEGALLRMKVTKDTFPLELFDKMTFEILLGMDPTTGPDHG